jgi:hypothetical protein
MPEMKLGKVMEGGVKVRCQKCDQVLHIDKQHFNPAAIDVYSLECDICDNTIYEGPADPHKTIDFASGIGGFFEDISHGANVKTNPDDTNEVEGSCENCDTELQVIDPVEGDNGELYCSIKCLNEAYQ